VLASVLKNLPGGVQGIALRGLLFRIPPTERTEVSLSHSGGRFTEHGMLYRPEGIAQVYSHYYEMTEREPMEESGAFQEFEIT
jgi:hypothetical protein